MKMNLINDIFLTESTEDKKHLIKIFQKQVVKYFDNTLPRKYYLFPKYPEVYLLSKSICIEMSSWGSERYRKKLSLFLGSLREDYKVDFTYFDGKTTAIIGGLKDDNKRRCY